MSKEKGAQKLLEELYPGLTNKEITDIQRSRLKRGEEIRNRYGFVTNDDFTVSGDLLKAYKYLKGKFNSEILGEV